MINPFQYGNVVVGEAFCNRRAELRDLQRAVENGEKVFVYSERRLGKTSLVRTVLDSLSEVLLKADCSLAAEADSSVWSSGALLAQASPLQMRSSWFSLAGRFEVMDGAALVRTVWPFPSPLVWEARYYGRC
jgi:hypothetical protein